MPATNQGDFATQMVAQLRALDPAISAEIGTPERKIIDTVAQALAETQVDLTVLNGALNLDSKFGDSLDKFLQILGFARQASTYATGFIKFSRPTSSTLNITVPAGTQIFAPAITSNVDSTSNVLYATTFGVTLQAGQTSVVAPIQAILPGTSGNQDIGRVTAFANITPNGITRVANEQPITGGIDQETDDEFKVRFKNTVFRNLAGTYDQYLSLAVSTQFTTKANVIGPVSRYREYVQVPAVDDASTDPATGTFGNGSAGQYTTAVSTLPYSKYTHSQIPYFVSNGKSGPLSLFYRQDTDFTLNIDNKNRGDAYREFLSGTGPDPIAGAAYRPNITLSSVYTGVDPTIQSIKPRDIVLFEHSYVSTESRNDPVRNINNCVDIFIDGGNLVTADAIIPRPSTGTPFVTVPTNKFYFDNFRRVGEPSHRPVVGNIFTALFWQPTLALPPEIIVGAVSYFKGLHYFEIEDVSELRGTIRARNGIEWAIGVPGSADGDPTIGPFTGPVITAITGDNVKITGYQFDKNIIDLQTSLEGAKQITTDVLAHTARNRYFKLDVTVMYSAGSNGNDVNLSIKNALSQFLGSQYYGQVIQMSDLLAVIHNTSGVDNVRWSSDLSAIRHKVTECDAFGKPLLNALVNRVTQGTAVLSEVQQYYIVGAPTGGTYTIKHGTQTTIGLPHNAAIDQIQTALNAAGILATITGLGTTVSPFTLTFTGFGGKTLISTKASFSGGSAVFDSDFFLKDDELPSLTNLAIDNDTLPGLIIRPRAQNVWQQIAS